MFANGVLQAGFDIHAALTGGRGVAGANNGQWWRGGWWRISAGCSAHDDSA